MGVWESLFGMHEPQVVGKRAEKKIKVCHIEVVYFMMDPPATRGLDLLERSEAWVGEW